MSNYKTKFSKLLYEFISVSFAVLLALLVNQWREDHNNNKFAKQAVINIKEEIKDNKDDISDLIKNHKLLLGKLDSIVQTEEDVTSVEDIINDLNITLINSSAWEMAKVTKAVLYIDFDDINNLAKVYNFQSYYESIVKQYILSNSLKNNVDINELENTRVFLNSIIPMEENLEQYYDLILNQVLEKYSD